MSAKREDGPVSTRFRNSAVLDIHRSRVQRLVLYGSRVRGEERPDSDFAVSAMPYPAGAYEDRTSLMREIGGDGIDL